ncbi:MAG TPA: hypothetical protein VGV90_07405 [Solirubrobacteraceae bacterium]|nr:hypothetical protein [Solirubrobacteraceae bacterium]
MSQRNTQQQTERRAVRSDDESLSPRANELLTRELREAVGSDEAVVPKDLPRRATDAHGGQSKFVAALSSNRPLVIVTFVAALVLGGVIALVTGQYWAVVVACAVHAVGTLLVAAGAISMTTQTEHVDPTVAARLEEEGVGNPDALLSDLVEDFAGEKQARGVPEVISSGHNERTVAPEDDAARSAVEQRSAMTPTSGASEVAGADSSVAALPWWVVLGCTVLSVGVALILGGDMWALPAIVIPIALGWVALQTWMARGPRSSAESQRPSGDREGAQRRLMPIGLFVVAGVVWFMLVVGWLSGLL